MSELPWTWIGIGIAALWVFSAAVGAMPKPTETSSAGYKFAYEFVHTLAGNVTPLVERIWSAINRFLGKKLDAVAPKEPPNPPAA